MAARSELPPQDSPKSDHGAVALDGDKIKSLRRRRGWDQRQLANRVGCDPKTIENAESGRPVRLKTASDLAAALRVTPEALIVADVAEVLGPDQPPTGSSGLFGQAPPMPDLVVGRDTELQEVKARLCSTGQQTLPVLQVITAVRGWAGVGKTTFARALAHHPDIVGEFAGVLWVALGERPNVLAGLCSWASALGLHEAFSSVDQASSRIAAILRHRRMLLIIDDVWDAEDATWFKLGGLRCATLLLTRETSVANQLAPGPNVYILRVLDEKAAIGLLEFLAPDVVAMHRHLLLSLVRDLGGLPLGLQVAGRLLHSEAAIGSDIVALITELRDTARIFQEKPPTEIGSETNATVAAVFHRSTDRLDPYVRDCFAALGTFAAQPASFDLTALQSVWGLDDARPLARLLINRGLLEAVGEKRFHIHQLVAKHARFYLRASPASPAWQVRSASMPST